MYKHHSRGDQELNRRDFLKLTSMAIPGLFLFPNQTFAQQSQNPSQQKSLLEYLPGKEENIYFKFVSPENIPNKKEIKIQNINPEILNNLKKSNPYEYTQEQISQLEIKGLEQKAIALGEIRPLSEEDKDYVFLGINKFDSIDSILDFYLPPRTIFKKDNLLIENYISKRIVEMKKEPEIIQKRSKAILLYLRDELMKQNSLAMVTEKGTLTKEEKKRLKKGFEKKELLGKYKKEIINILGENIYKR